MHLPSAYVAVGIIHICAVVTKAAFFWWGKAGMMLLTRSPLGPLSPGLPVAPLE